MLNITILCKEYLETQISFPIGYYAIITVIMIVCLIKIL